MLDVENTERIYALKVPLFKFLGLKVFMTASRSAKGYLTLTIKK